MSEFECSTRCFDIWNMLIFFWISTFWRISAMWFFFLGSHLWCSYGKDELVSFCDYIQTCTKWSLGGKDGSWNCVYSVQTLLNSTEVENFILNPLSAQNTETAVCTSLGVPNMPRNLLKVILDKAQGNPFFAQQLANHFKEQVLIWFLEEILTTICEKGVFKILFGRVVISPNIDLTKVNVPENIKSLITSRVDR